MVSWEQRPLSTKIKYLLNVQMNNLKNEIIRRLGSFDELAVKAGRCPLD